MQIQMKEKEWAMKGVVISSNEVHTNFNFDEKSQRVCESSPSESKSRLIIVKSKVWYQK